jgi:DNA-directed RNA polymerase specialized sigma24 family protein
LTGIEGAESVLLTVLAHFPDGSVVRLSSIHGFATVSLSEVDRQLLQRCLDGSPRAWQDFADRFLGLVVHVANHTAEARGLSIDASTRDDLVADVFLAILKDDLAVLKRFRRNCSLATYLTVIARRVIVRRLTSQLRNGHQRLNRLDQSPTVMDPERARSTATLAAAGSSRGSSRPNVPLGGQELPRD